MKNIGSITSIYYAMARNVNAISAPDENGAVQVTFYQGWEFVQFEFTPESASFTEDQKDTDAGAYYEQNASFRLPKIRSAMHNAVQSLVNNDIILKITDGNGITVLMGSKDTPVRGSWKLIRPQGASGYNGYEASFKCNALEPAPFLDESFVIS